MPDWHLLQLDGTPAYCGEEDIERSCGEVFATGRAVAEPKRRTSDRMGECDLQ
ncbi:hypothetical protein GCM10010172_86010 [Paractinoplanes ferrugineus]|uniref:Uncharacterized protein n=1 Tax=Paractinoplanes ferrugineus TaxID=113564 RepID=A0A919J7D6_9ACTN|nr:hypothetical protein [Actinoplanes ferrugineus]GIE15185.1 hypothetical protein Afe05nite_70250 [Actinoplanes ferrugineus]